MTVPDVPEVAENGLQPTPGETLPPVEAILNEPTGMEPAPTPIEEPTVPLHSVSSLKILADDLKQLPKELPKDNKRERWKATPLERRKVIIVDDLIPDA